MFATGMPKVDFAHHARAAKKMDGVLISDSFVVKWLSQVLYYRRRQIEVFTARLHEVSEQKRSVLNLPGLQKSIRLVRKRTERVLRGKVELRDISKGLDSVIKLLPFDDRLLMPRKGSQRHISLNRQLAWSLAFIAGAVNAGGFLAVGRYTSHVSGAVSSIGDEFTLGHPSLAIAALAVVIFFLAGAFVAAMLINLGKSRRFRSKYAFSLLLEAGLLLLFGVIGWRFNQRYEFYLPGTVILLSIVMGMHNAVVTTISNAEVRTTHMTGNVTDLGIELSRLLYINRTHRKMANPVVANRDRIKLHGLLVISFLGGGVAGALGFKFIGYKFTVILAGMLFVLALRPLVYDLRVRQRLMRMHAR